MATVQTEEESITRDILNNVYKGYKRAQKSNVILSDELIQYMLLVMTIDIAPLECKKEELENFKPINKDQKIIIDVQLSSLKSKISSILKMIENLKKRMKKE